MSNTNKYSKLKAIEKEFGHSANVLKALSHPIRVFIVQKLEAGELCVCEITEMVGVDISTISRHLAVLRNAGIVSDDKRGQSVYYSLTMPCVLNFFSCILKEKR